MALSLSVFAVVSLGVSPALAQQSKPSAARAPIVQPGAPGQRSKTLTPAAVRAKPKTPQEADISFMEGMIMHHAQAVDMVDLLRTRGESPALKALGERMTISQSDEIKYMKQWLQDHKPAPAGHDRMDHMDMDDMGGMPPMPGMLTPQQMAALAKARGPEFDHLFLTGMIQHHTGALVMVDDLFAIPGAGQEPAIYDFATDIDNTQRAEIEIMRAMLKEKKQ